MKIKRHIIFGFSLMLLLLYSSICFAATNISDPIRKNTTWSLAGSPYVVIQNIRVDKGVTLTIEPGVRVEFYREAGQEAPGNKFNMTIEGQLIAIGTKDNPVIFTSSDINPQRGDWEHIEFADTSVGATYSSSGKYLSGSILEYVIVEYGGGGDYSAKGAIYGNGKAPYINNVTVRNNAKVGIEYQNITEAYIDNSIFSDNYPENSDESQGRSGGAILYYTDSIDNSFLTVNSSIFTGNSVYGEGGAISISDSIADVSITVNKSTFTGNASNEHGGAIYTSFNSYLTVNDSTFKDNSAGSDGGAICSYSDAPLMVNSSVFNDNSAHGHGGALYSSSGSVTVNNSTFSGNSTDFDYAVVFGGGAICSYYSALSINNSKFTDNFAGHANGDYYECVGGAIYSSHSSLTVNNSTFKNNSAVSDGGAIYYYAFDFSLTVNNSILTGNSAISDGSAIFSYAKTNLTDTIIYGNYGQTAVSLIADGTISKSTIVNNYPASDSSTKTNNGVYVYSDNGNDDSVLTISDSNIFGHEGYDIINSSDNDINAANNYWGTTEEISININMFDEFDDASIGEIIYYPYLSYFTVGRCGEIDNDFGLTFDYGRAESSGYQFQFKYFPIQSEPYRLIWKLDETLFDTLESISSAYMNIIPDFRAKVLCAEYNGMKYRFDLIPFLNPVDTKGVYFELDPVTLKSID